MGKQIRKCVFVIVFAIFKTTKIKIEHLIQMVRCKRRDTILGLRGRFDHGDPACGGRYEKIAESLEEGHKMLIR